MKKAWVVVRPCLDYEDSLSVIAVAMTKDDADAAADRINAFFQALRGRLEKMPDPFAHEISDEEHERRWDARQKVISRARWPYGHSFESDLSSGGKVAVVMDAPLVVGAKA